MNKLLYKIVFIISFVLTFVIAYVVYQFLFPILATFDFVFLNILIINIFYILYLFLYIYDVFLIFKRKDVVLEKKDLIVPVIYILFSLFIFIVSYVAYIDFKNIVKLDSIGYELSWYLDYFNVGYYSIFLIIPCLFNLLWTYALFRKKKSEKDVK